MAKRLYLHIGTMKAATTYLQHLFDVNEDLLARHGIAWHGSDLNQDAILEFQGAGMMHPTARGSWQTLSQQISDAAGDVLVSMELMARMPAERAERLVSAWEAESVSLIITARELSRVAPSHWQETTQNRGTTPWADWMAEICASDPADRDGPLFWRHHYLPNIVEAWSRVAPPERTHLVTIPSSGGDPGVVWKRFASVLGVTADEVVEPRFNNASLGGHSAELMRRLNGSVSDLPFPRYRWGFKAALAKQTLSHNAGEEPRPVPSAEQHARLRAVALEMVRRLGDGRVTVVGDLQDLVPPEAASAEPYDPGTATETELLTTAMLGLAGLGTRVGRLQVERERLHREREELRLERSRLEQLLEHYERRVVNLSAIKERLPPRLRRRLGRMKRALAGAS